MYMVATERFRTNQIFGLDAAAVYVMNFIHILPRLISVSQYQHAS